MLLALLLAAPQATGDPRPNCKDPQTQLDINQCASLETARADAAMNKQWVITKAKVAEMDKGGGVNPSGKRGSYAAALLASQRAWLAYRDAECQIESFAMRGGSGEWMLHADCMIKLTLARTEELSDLGPQH
ncbi:lysozyme inhibitor LprI family protein [uncultured Sphingomonas sp.]